MNGLEPEDIIFRLNPPADTRYTGYTLSRRVSDKPMNEARANEALKTVAAELGLPSPSRVKFAVMPDEGRMFPDGRIELAWETTTSYARMTTAYVHELVHREHLVTPYAAGHRFQATLEHIRTYEFELEGLEKLKGVISPAEYAELVAAIQAKIREFKMELDKKIIDEEKQQQKQKRKANGPTISVDPAYERGVDIASSRHE